jgi:hypothetical protein
MINAAASSSSLDIDLLPAEVFLSASTNFDFCYEGFLLIAIVLLLASYEDATPLMISFSEFGLGCCCS